MALDVAAFVSTRPYAYHLTSRKNLISIARSGRIESAATLVLKDGRAELLKQPRLEHVVVKADGGEISLRDQAPLHHGNLALGGGWSFDDLVDVLNDRVFLWPGTGKGPNGYGRRHFGRYRAEAPVIIRVKTTEFLQANRHSVVEFCPYNSGSPRYSGGRPSPRGPDTFVAAARFPGPPAKGRGVNIPGCRGASCVVGRRVQSGRPVVRWLEAFEAPSLTGEKLRAIPAAGALRRLIA